MSNFTPTVTGTDVRARIQRFGSYLSGMVMPNIGAFIAFGFITALFIPDGWTPNADLAEMVGPMIVVLIPTLVAYTGGRMVHGQRGAVIGAIATFGAIVAGADPVSLADGASVLPFGGQVMILGAFVLGPLSAYLLKLFDNLVADKVKAGFEMLSDNFSIGILGAVMAIFGYKVIEPAVGWITDRLGDGVETIVSNSLLPLTSVIIEPFRRRTSTRCSSASARSRRTSVRASPSRTAPSLARTPCCAMRSATCGSPTLSTGTATLCRCASASRRPAKATSRCSPSSPRY
jgi:mannitol-specific phosphotransferase system IIBC component